MDQDKIGNTLDFDLSAFEVEELEARLEMAELCLTWWGDWQICYRD